MTTQKKIKHGSVIMSILLSLSTIIGLIFDNIKKAEKIFHTSKNIIELVQSDSIKDVKIKFLELAQQTIETEFKDSIGNIVRIQTKLSITNDYLKKLRLQDQAKLTANQKIITQLYRNIEIPKIRTQIKTDTIFQTDTIKINEQINIDAFDIWIKKEPCIKKNGKKAIIRKVFNTELYYKNRFIHEFKDVQIK